MTETPLPEANADLRRLRWQCRRGMLELDLLLNAFMDQGYSQLTPAEQADFLRLLSFQDQLLQAWLIGGVEPDEPSMGALVSRIRAL